MTTRMFVSTSSSSYSAREMTDMLSKRIVVIDDPQLARSMIRHEVGCRVEEWSMLKKPDEAFLDGLQSEAKEARV